MPSRVDLSNNVVAQGMVRVDVPSWMLTASGAMKMRGFTATVVKNAVGDFSVQLDSPIANDDMQIQCSPVMTAFVFADAPVTVGVHTIVPGLPGPVINILLRNAVGVLVDVRFALVVTLQEISH